MSDLPTVGLFQAKQRYGLKNIVALLYIIPIYDDAKNDRILVPFSAMAILGW